MDKKEYKQLIERVITNETKLYRIDNENLKQMCILVSNDIDSKLNELGIDSTIIDTEKLFGIYKHQFVISKNEEDYYLIDPTYNQFKRDDNDLDKDSPIKRMIDDEIGIKFALNLTRKGYSKVNNYLINKYINSFVKNERKIDVTIDELVLEGRYK